MHEWCSFVLHSVFSILLCIALCSPLLTSAHLCSSFPVPHSPVNASLVKHEQDKRMISLWNTLGHTPADFLQPGRSLLSITKVEVAPGMLHHERGYQFGKRKEYLCCVMSDIILFARPNKVGLFRRQGNKDGTTRAAVRDRDASEQGGATVATHHVKMVCRFLDIRVTETYACTQPNGESGFELRVLNKIGAKDMQQGISPYQAYAIWCDNPDAKEVLSTSIQEALEAKLNAFFSRKKVTPVPKKIRECREV